MLPCPRRCPSTHCQKTSSSSAASVSSRLFISSGFSANQSSTSTGDRLVLSKMAIQSPPCKTQPKKRLFRADGGCVLRVQVVWSTLQGDLIRQQKIRAWCLPLCSNPGDLTMDVSLKSMSFHPESNDRPGGDPTFPPKKQLQGTIPMSFPSSCCSNPFNVTVKSITWLNSGSPG